MWVFGIFWLWCLFYTHTIGFLYLFILTSFWFFFFLSIYLFLDELQVRYKREAKWEFLPCRSIA